MIRYLKCTAILVLQKLGKKGINLNWLEKYSSLSIPYEYFKQRNI